MDPTLHQKQAVNHLNRVLAYAPAVAEDGEATVHLTAEDWHVVADALFKMNTPDEMLPDEIQGYSLTNENRTIELKTEEYLISLEAM